MAFRIGTIEFGVSANVAQAVRGIQQLHKELGTLERVSARVQRGLSSSDRKGQIQAQIDIIRAQRQRISEEIRNMRLLQEQRKADKASIQDQIGLEQRRIKEAQMQRREAMGLMREQFLATKAQIDADQAVRKSGIETVSARLKAEKAAIDTQRRARQEQIREARTKAATIAEQLTLAKQGLISIPANVRTSMKQEMERSAKFAAAAAARDAELRLAEDARIAQQQYALDRAKATHRARELAETQQINALKIQGHNQQRIYQRAQLADEQRILDLRKQSAALTTSQRTQSAIIRLKQLRQEELRGQEQGLARQLQQLNADERRNELLRQQQAIADSVRDSVTALAIGFATGSLLRFAQESTILAARVENLGTVLQNVGSIAGYNEAQLASLEDRVKSLGITTRAARESLSVLALNEQDLGQAATLARIAQDAAAIAAINSSQAFEKLTVAIQRLDTRMLRQLGIVVNLRQVYAKYALETGKTAETLTAAEKQQLLMNEVLARGANIAGTYEASLQDAFKQLTTMDRFVEEMRREFGENFLPVFEAGVSLLTKAVLAATEASKSYGALTAGLVSASVAAGGTIVAIRGLTLAQFLLGVTFKDTYAWMLKQTAAAGAARSATLLLGRAAAFAASPLGLGLLIGGISAAVGAFVAYQSSVRNATRAEEERARAARKTAQEFFEVREAAKTVQELGSFSVRTAEQQDKLTASINKIIALLPNYSARLRAVAGDAQAFMGVLTEINSRFAKTEEEINAEFANRAQRIEQSIGLIVGGPQRASLLSGSTNTVELSGRTFFRGLQGVGERKGPSGGPAVDALTVIRAAAADAKLSVDQAASAIQFLFKVEDPSVLRQLLELYRNLNDERRQLVDVARRTQELQQLDSIFEGQQSAAESVLRLTKDFEQEREKLIKDTNFEVAKDYVKLTKALETVYLTEEQIIKRRDLRIALSGEEVTRRFAKEVERAQSALAEAEDGTARRDAQEELDQILNKRDAALLELRQKAEDEASEARKMLQDRTKLEADALAALEARLAVQGKEAEAIERDIRLTQLEAEGTKQLFQAEEKLLEIQERRAAFEDSMKRLRGDLESRRDTFQAQGNTAEVSALNQQLDRLSQIQDAQLRTFDAQAKQIRQSVHRSRVETTREVDEFIKQTQERLGVMFRDGKVKKIAEPFRELAARVAEFRQEFKKTVDDYIEQAKRAQNAQQVSQIGGLFNEQIKQARRARWQNLRSLIDERNTLFTRPDEEFEGRQNELARDLLSQGFSQEEVNNRLEQERAKHHQRLADRRDELDKQIRDARLADAEQRKIEEQERARFQEQLANRTESLAIESAMTVNMSQQAQLATTIANEEERRLQAAKELASLTGAMTVTVGGFKQPLPDNTSLGIPGVGLDKKGQLQHTFYPGASPEEMLQDKTGVNNPEIDPLAGLRTTLGMLPSTFEDLAYALSEDVNAMREMRGSISDLQTRVVEHSSQLDAIIKDLRREREAFKAAIQGRGLTR